MYINVSIDLLYKKITSLQLIVYFAAVAKYNLARNGLRATTKFRVGSYVI